MRELSFPSPTCKPREMMPHWMQDSSPSTGPANWQPLKIILDDTRSIAYSKGANLKNSAHHGTVQSSYQAKGNFVLTKNGEFNFRSLEHWLKTCNELAENSQSLEKLNQRRLKDFDPVNPDSGVN